MLLAFPSLFYGQGLLKGVVKTIDAEGKEQKLIGANVYWVDLSGGTTTNENGLFLIEKKEQDHMLVISYVGFVADTIHVHDLGYKTIILRNKAQAAEFEIQSRQRATTISSINPIKTEVLGQKELRKAACCNLSESFETNPTVDVSYGDAVTGTRQITMLGLSGRYSMISRELIPSIRTLSNVQGLQFIPGPWIESIQIAKGAGSVVHGFESMSGQINVELFKPETADKLYVNAYLNEGLRNEINIVSGKKISNKVSTAMFLHANSRLGKFDMNQDNFQDMPTGRQLNLMNRWQFYTDNNWEMQLGVHALIDEREAGELKVPTNDNRKLYRLNMRERYLDFFAKAGHNFERPSTSLGFQFNGRLHENRSSFGNRIYDANQQSMFLNSIFQSYLGNTNHQYKIGLGTQIDQIDEQINTGNFNRLEQSTGAFVEYAYSPNERFNVITGLRADYHNYFGWFATPRLHLRYAIKDETILRLSAGRGQRTASILADQYRFFASERALNIVQSNSNLPYGLQPEVSFNYGVNLTHNFKLNYREGSISLDLYRTDFANRVVADWDHSTSELLMYNIENLSYANSAQLEINYELFKRFDVKLAHRFFESRTKYTRGWLQHPMLATHRAFANLAYETKNEKWLFDLTAVWTGGQRLPFTDNNPIEFQLPNNVNPYWLLNAQVAYMTGKRTEVYIGVENLNNFRINTAINSPDNPSSPYFDTNFAWGPIFGRMVYAGFRFRIPQN